MYPRFFKRFLDIVCSLLALIVFSPLLLLLTIVGAIKMKGNPFFTQLRPGKDEKIFRLIKFRTMTCEKDKDGHSLPDEQRIVPYGTFLRSTSLDELPELLNILVGDMSVVGPRPLLVKDMVFMTPDQRRRHSVRQGLTGLAQVSGRNAITWEQKLAFDLQYIDSGISFWKDFKIILKTVEKVLKRHDVVREGTVSDVDLGVYLLQQGAINQAQHDKLVAEARAILAKVK